ncbi:MAG: hypothetical protein GX928_05890 [Ruminococcaceae bacterium]|nr:hypothetical protein [Oscillospiraceae bacterium]
MKSEPSAAPVESAPAPVPEQSYTPPAPERSYTPPVPEQSSTPPAPQQSYAPPVPEQSYTPPAPQQSYVPPVPEQSYTPPAPEQSYTPPAPEQSYTPPAPQQSYAPPVPEQSYTPPAPQQSYAPPAPEQSYTPPAPQQKKKKGGKTAIIIVSVILGLALIAAGIFLLPKLLGGSKGFSTYEELIDEYFNILEEGDTAKFKNLMQPEAVKTLGQLGIKDTDLAYNRDAMTFYYGETVSLYLIGSYNEYADPFDYLGLSFIGIMSDDVEEYAAISAEAEIVDSAGDATRQVFVFDVYRIGEKWYLFQVNDGQIYGDAFESAYYSYEDLIDAYFMMFEEGAGEKLVDLVQPDLADFLFESGYDISTDQTMLDNWTDYYGSTVLNYTIEDVYYYSDSDGYDYIQDMGFDVSEVEEYIDVSVTAEIDSSGDSESLFMDFDLVCIEGSWYIIVVY